MKPPYTEPVKTAGMSLIEVVIAIAISAFILASAASFIVSITDIWAKREQRYAFYEHADGVTQFLKISFRSSGALSDNSDSKTDSDADLNNQNKPEINSGSQSEKNSALAEENAENQTGTVIRWEVPPFSNSSDEALLHFQLPSITPLLTKADRLLPAENSVYLTFDSEEGLSLLHRSNFEKGIEADEIDADDFSRTLLSPYIESVEYIYWESDNERWEVNDEPIMEDDSDTYRLPNYLKLNFTYKDNSIERIIPIPSLSKHLILY